MGFVICKVIHVLPNAGNNRDRHLIETDISWTFQMNLLFHVFRKKTALNDVH